MSNEPGRNDPCPCGSGRKYKHCCLDRDEPKFERIEGKVVPKALDELMQEGYDHREEGNEAEAADCWLEVWERIKQFITPDTGGIKDLDEQLAPTQFVFNWSQDLEHCLHQAGRKTDKYLEEQIRYADEFCELLPGTKDSVLINRRKAAAEACFHLGRVEEGENRFEQIVSEHPDSPWVFINWGDMYSLFRRHDNVPEDPERARELYEQARPLLDGYEVEAVENRLMQLKNKDEQPRKNTRIDFPKRRDKTMNIELTEEQFETLLTLVQAGNWLINATRSDRIERFDELVSQIYSKAEEAGLGEHVFYAEDEDRYYPSEKLEEKIMDFVDTYENESFWDSLTTRLAERDIREKYDRETVENMGLEEWVETLHEHERHYAEEFQEHGLERISIEK